MCKIQSLRWVLGSGEDTKMKEMQFLTHNGQKQGKEKDTDVEEMLRVSVYLSCHKESWEARVR